MNYKVVIEKKHCINLNGSIVRYADNQDCPLYRAIKEQLPDFPLNAVFSNTLRDENETYYRFQKDDNIKKDVWNWDIMNQIISGERQNAIVEF